MLAILRYLRHGPLKRYPFFWCLLGRFYRHLVSIFPIFPDAKQMIGPYGPFRFHPRFAFSAFSQWGKQHNAGFIDCINSCSGKKCVLDVGAHIGLVAMPMSRVISTQGKVYAFEPAVINREYLAYHLKKNHIQNIEIIPLLIGEKSKIKVPFYELDTDTGMNSVVPIQGMGPFQRREKQQISLDSFCEHYHLRPEVIKIDAEGYEFEILQGAKKTLLSNEVRIYLSLHPRHLNALGHSIMDLLHFIDLVGYQLTTLSGLPIEDFLLGEYLMTPKQ